MNNRSSEENLQEESFLVDSFQTRDHENLLYIMSLLDFEVNWSGMCEGFALTALYYHAHGKLNEYDELIQNLSKIYHESFKTENKENYIISEIANLDKEAENAGSITTKELFNFVEEFQNKQDQENKLMDFTESVEGIYDNDDINRFLQSIYDKYADELENNKERIFSIPIILRSHAHTLLLIFHDQDVLIRDINYPNKHYFEDNEQIFALALNQSPSTSLVISSQFFIPKNPVDASLVSSCYQQWKNTNDYKILHEINEERMSRIGKDGNSLIANAVINNDKELFDYICDSLQDPEHKFIFTKALFNAIVDDRKEMLADLLAHPNVDINLPATSSAHGYSFTPLTTAIFFGYIDLAKTLIDSNADINGKSNLRLDTLLVHNNIEEQFRRLSENSIDKFKEMFKSVSFNKNMMIQDLTPLHFAAILGNKEMVDILLEKGAKITRCTGNICPDDFARFMGYDVIAKDILNKFKDDITKQMDILSQIFQQDQVRHLKLLIERQNSAKEMIAILNLVNNVNRLMIEISLDGQLYTIFAAKIDKIYSQLFSETSPMQAEDANEINSSVEFILSRIKLMNKFNSNKSLTKTPFSDLQNQTILELKEGIAYNTINYTLSLEQALVSLNDVINIIQSTEKSKFLAYSVHQDWKDLIKDCYDKLTVTNNEGYSLIIQKMKIVTEIYKTRQGLKYGIEDIKTPIQKEKLNENIKVVKSLPTFQSRK